MAKIDPRTGALSGKLGNMVYCNWNGITYVRSLPTQNPDREPSPAQLAQRQKFALGNRFASTLGPLLNLAFHNTKPKQTGKQAAFSYLSKNAITGVAPHFELDYPRILISSGVLPGTPEASATGNADGQVLFQWVNVGDKGYAATTDKVLLVLYCPALEQSIYNSAAADRRAERVTLDASPFSGHTVHSWLGFCTASGKRASNSIYTGTFLIS
jgi:hypothetical protein